MITKTLILILSLMMGNVIAQDSGKEEIIDLQGAWENELGSVFHIDSIATSGEIHGRYASSTGVDGKVFPMQGFINYTEENPTEINVSFTVRWEGYGSITSWTGYVYKLEGKEKIKTMWHLVRSGKEYDWERIITNSSTFTKLEE